MKIKTILSILIVFTFLSCKNNEKENKPSFDSQPKDFTSETITSESSATIKTELFTNDLDQNRKLLLGFYKKNTQEPQLFIINNNRDTTIVCNQKTRIKIYAKSFVSSNTSKDILDKVQISVNEYYKISDILLTNLSTTTNGNLLETGGMINITATSNQKKCDLKKGKTIEIEFPRKEEKEGMQLYTGNWSNNNINWQVQNNSIDLNQIFTKVDQKPEFPGGIEKFYNYISTSINIEDEITTRVIAAFTIDKEGNVINPKIIKGHNKKINAQVIALLKKCKKFIPGKIDGKAVNTSYTFPINIVTDGIIEEKVSEDFQKDFEKNYDNKNLQDAGSGNINYYLFSSSVLGYINCDRLWKNTLATKIDYVVNFDNNSETNATIIFHRIKSIMSESSNTNKIAFNNIPVGEKITIFAIKYFDKKPFLAIKETETSIQVENNLAFKPVTMEILKSEMKKLDRFN